MKPFELLIRNTSEVLCVTGAPSAAAESALAPIARGAVGIASGQIEYLGPEASLPAGAVSSTTEVIDALGGFVGPGFVDPHTHLVFAGERSREFELRNQGATYLEIAQAGGGIMNTVRATRAASVDELVALALPRLTRMLAQGVTTAEVKSGYGLNLADELKMLEAVRRLGKEQALSLWPTLLCAHAIPEEHKADRARYVELCEKEILPQVAAQGLAKSFDIFIEAAAFTLEEGRRLLTAAKKTGLDVRVHADQLSAIGASELAAELGARSADHLERITEAGIAALARAGVSAVLVPISTLFLKVRPYAPGRKLRDAGINVALGTNVNPGSAMSENLPLTLGLACLENGLTAAEAYYAVTRGAALALGLADAGQLVAHGPADLVVFGCESYRHLPYHLGVNHAKAVVKAGKIVARSASLQMPLCR
jgi:imidazolonepropionase